MEGEMLKGHLDMIVLAALASGPAHGYAVIEEIRRRSGQAFDLPEGTIYPALHRLEQAGLLSSRWVTAESGRRRRVYALTRQGSRALAERRAVWRQFSDAIGGLLEGRGHRASRHDLRPISSELAGTLALRPRAVALRACGKSKITCARRSRRIRARDRLEAERRAIANFGDPQRACRAVRRRLAGAANPARRRRGRARRSSPCWWR